MSWAGTGASAPLAEKPGGESDDYRLSEEYQALKARMHAGLIEVIEEERLDVADWPVESLRRFVEGKVDGFISQERLAVNRREAAMLVDDMIDEVAGLGPIQPLIEDDGINDVLVNGHMHVFAELEGRMQRMPLRFIDDRHLMRIIQRIVAPIGRRIDESSPMVDGRLADGSRVNAVIPPVALDGPCLSIRKFRKDPLRAGDLIAFGSVTHEILELLGAAVRGRCNILVSGGTGSGKTTMLNIMSDAIPSDERLVTIEDTAELRLRHEHVVRLETRPPNLEGRGEIDTRSLVRNALRMRPDRIIVGEIRSHEVMDMLQAMNTGHEGSMATIHSNAPRDCLSRIELLMGFGGFSGSERTLRQTVSDALDLIIQIERSAAGERRLTHVSEVLEPIDGQYRVHDLFCWDPRARQFRREINQPHGERLLTALSQQRSSTPFGSKEPTRV